MQAMTKNIFATLVAISLAPGLSLTAYGQSDSAPQSGEAPPAATTPAQLNAENPPLSGLDAPSAEPAYGGRSYLVPGIQLSESADSNANGAAGTGSHVAAVSRGLGSLDLQKIWKTYQLGIDYIAGGVFYFGPHTAGQTRAYQVHTLGFDQRILWRTGQLAIRDSFNYLPEGTFGFSSYGGAGSFGSALGGQLGGSTGNGTGIGGGLTGGSLGGLFGGGSFGAVGIQPRVDNSSVVDIVQQISPRSSVTLAGGYGFTTFLDQPQKTFNLVNSQQITAQVGYNRLLSKRDQVGVSYAFEDLHFPTAGSGTINAHVWHVLYGHRISGRLNFTASGGPQLIIIRNPGILALLFGQTTKRVSGSGAVGLHYIFSSRTNGQIMYQRYVTPGSGFYAGANTDAVRVTLSHLFGRHWNSSIDGGYSRNSSLQTVANAINSNSYQYWYAGGSLRRQIGQHFGAFASYQFNQFGSGRCASAAGSTAVCGQPIQQHIGSIGIDWHPRPIRLD
jgi:hypothetical protein